MNSMTRLTNVIRWRLNYLIVHEVLLLRLSLFSLSIAVKN